MHNRRAEDGKIFVLTLSGKLSLPPQETAGRDPGEPVEGREELVPLEWITRGYVLEVWKR